tara:strand:- start:217 stop:1527 length:1311 start_codon:yes stop_codon:yes gene_type:complete
MSPMITFGVMAVILIAGIFSGSMVALAMGLVAALSMAFFLGVPNLAGIGPSLWGTSYSFILTCIPLFILMGCLLSESGASKRLFDALFLLLRRLPGGLMLSVLLGGGVLGAATGSAVADTATIGVVAYPEMSRRGYHRGLSAAAIAVGGTVGILMPPSIIMIIFGGITMTSIGHLFIGGIVPAILMVTLLMISVMIMVKINPALVPPVESARTPLKEDLLTFVRVIPVILLIVFVLGSIYVGLATPTEVASIGALIALVLSFVYRGFSRKMLRDALRTTVKLSSFIIFIVCASSLVMYSVTYLNVIPMLTEKIVAAELSPYLLIGLTFAAIILLGCIIETMSLTVLMVPILFPLITSLGFHPVYFGVMFVICIQISLVTPPVGLCLYTVQGIAKEVPVISIAKSSIPFIIAQVAVLVICTIFPELVLWLPGTMLTR